MKKFTKRISTLVLLFLAIMHYADAQCTIDSTQTTAGIYPDTIAEAIVNHAYTQDITFVMITDTLGFTITNYHIVSITGLPIGMTWACNNTANGCNYDPAVNLYGCINISGTPLLAGAYTLTVSIVATLAIVGDQNIDYNVPFNVLPDTVGNAGFSMINSGGCAPLTVTFTNNLPGQSTYLWDFGNSVTDSTENPAPQTYVTPGDYVVTQTVTTFVPDQYFLTEVRVDSVPENYNHGGIIDNDPDPDMYFVITDTAGNTVYDSHPAIMDTQPPYTWSLNIPLQNEMYNIHFYDLDSFFINLGDDDLGQINFAGWGTSGYGNDTLPGITGGLGAAYTIFLQAIPPIVTVSTDTVHVYPAPPVAIITASGSTTLCDGDSVVLTSDAASGNQWYQGGNIMLSSDTGQSLVVYASGTYSVVVTSSFGCTSSSAVTAVIVNPLPPKPTIFAQGDTIFCTLTGYSLQWYLNGGSISGATAQTYVPLVDGTYSVVATDSNGCSISSDPLLIVGVGIGELNLVNMLEITPNPSDGMFNLSFETSRMADFQVKVSDLAGRTVFTKEIKGAGGTYKMMIDLGAQSNGIYIFELRSGKFTERKKLIVND
jgi:hypothetical protein